MSCAPSLKDGLLASARRGLLPTFLAGLTTAELTFLKHDWPLWAHAHQLPPEGTWRVWLLMAGRGAGKTRAGAEWVRACVAGAGGGPARQIALIGETFADVREVMIEGVSGLLAVHPPHERPEWLPSRRRLEWPNGAVAHAFSSEDPEALRGPEFDLAWGDELGKWRRAEETFDMLQFGLRLGEHPRLLATTTPRPTPLMRRLVADPETALVTAASEANRAHLAPGFLAAVRRRYAGTRLGRQELDGELIEDRPDALFPRAIIEAWRVAAAPELARIVVAVDPPASSGRRSDACGIVAAGLGPDGTGYVLADRTRARAKPGDWAGAAVRLWRELAADCLVAEANQGGEMVREVIRGADPGVPVRLVRATRGKAVRAEPVALLYEQGRVRHAGVFPALEDEMADFGADGLSSGRSPDRLDALVWALSELMLRTAGEPRMRVV